jgi:hypothetical protein
VKAIVFSTFALTVAACGGAPETASPAPVEPTSGGESAPRMVQVLRTTTPVPVPRPATTREELAPAVQQIWTRTEEIVAIRPPEPPTEASEASIRAWAEDPFAPWVSARQHAVQDAEPLVDTIGEDALARAVAAALFGYMYEDTAAGIRGAPVPAELAEDAELLDLYVAALNDSLRPFAQRAVESYAYCATTIVQQNEEAWAEWARYCAERGRDVATVYELAPDDFPVAEPAEEPAEGAEPAAE